MPYIGKKPADVISTAIDATTGDFSGNVTAGGTLAVTGETTLATNLNMGDSDKIKLGASGDLEVYHDGSNSFVDDTGTGSLFLRGESQVIIGNMTGEQAAVFNDDGAVTLNHDNTKKFETTSSGVTVTGSITSEGGDNLFRNSSGSSIVSIIAGTSNSSILKLGDTDDFDIGQILYHHGVNQMVFHVNDTDFLSINSTGHLFLGTTSERNSGDLSIDFSGSSEAGIGINDTTSSNGSVFAGFLTGGTFRGSITNNNNGAVAYNTTSDYRLKENVSYDFDATARLKQLKPARFNWIADDTNTLQDGFLAHEVSSIVPEAITGTKDGTKTTANVVLDENENIIATGLTEDEWKAGKEIPKDSNGKDLTPMFASNTTWKASITQKHYQEIDQAKLVPLLVKTIQELEARIAVLESK